MDVVTSNYVQWTLNGTNMGSPECLFSSILVKDGRLLHPSYIQLTTSKVLDKKVEQHYTYHSTTHCMGVNRCGFVELSGKFSSKSLPLRPASFLQWMDATRQQLNKNHTDTINVAVNNDIRYVQYNHLINSLINTYSTGQGGAGSNTGQLN